MLGLWASVLEAGLVFSPPLHYQIEAIYRAAVHNHASGNNVPIFKTVDATKVPGSVRGRYLCPVEMSVGWIYLHCKEGSYLQAGGVSCLRATG